MSEIMTEGKKAKLIDETVYNDPYVVKSNCLYEMVQVKDQVVPMKLADFVPTLISEITRDDGTEQKKMFKVGAVWFCQYHLTHFIRTRIMQRERYDHSRAFFGLPEAVRRWRCRFFC